MGGSGMVETRGARQGRQVPGFPKNLNDISSAEDRKTTTKDFAADSWPIGGPFYLQSRYSTGYKVYMKLWETLLLIAV